jgi:hypothetical protein
VRALCKGTLGTIGTPEKNCVKKKKEVKTRKKMCEQKKRVDMWDRVRWGSLTDGWSGERTVLKRRRRREER